MNIKDNNDPYFNRISEYLYQEFPNVAQPNDCELLEILTTILVGTKEIRYGSMPSPESLVVIRQTIKESIELGASIPVLVPWGSLKAVNMGEEIDIAEVIAIQRLVKLNEQVMSLYTPGLDIVIRVEDTSGYNLFAIDKDKSQVVALVNSYSSKFVDLVYILSDNTITVSRESEMDNASKFNDLQDSLIPLFERYLKESDKMIKFMPNKVKDLDSYKLLLAAGWKGTISDAQRSFYYDSYNRIYEGSSLNSKRLALYLAQALTRVKLNMSGKRNYWKSFIQITFVQPIKGLPEGYHNNCLYYRTIPMSQGRTHICPWRAKGYLKIDSSVCAKITSANDPIDLLECTMNLTHFNRSVDVLIRYIIED